MEHMKLTLNEFKKFSQNKISLLDNMKMVWRPILKKLVDKKIPLSNFNKKIESWVELFREKLKRDLKNKE